MKSVKIKLSSLTVKSFTTLIPMQKLKALNGGGVPETYSPQGCEDE